MYQIATSVIYDLDSDHKRDTDSLVGGIVDLPTATVAVALGVAEFRAAGFAEWQPCGEPTANVPISMWGYDSLRERSVYIEVQVTKVQESCDDIARLMHLNARPLNPARPEATNLRDQF